MVDAVNEKLIELINWILNTCATKEVWRVNLGLHICKFVGWYEL